MVETGKPWLVLKDGLAALQLVSRAAYHFLSITLPNQANVVIWRASEKSSIWI